MNVFRPGCEVCVTCVGSTWPQPQLPRQTGQIYLQATFFVRESNIQRQSNFNALENYNVGHTCRWLCTRFPVPVQLPNSNVPGFKRWTCKVQRTSCMSDSLKGRLATEVRRNCVRIPTNTDGQLCGHEGHVGQYPVLCMLRGQ